MISEKWTLLRCQTKDTLKWQWLKEPDRTVHLTDVGLVIVPMHRLDRLLQDAEDAAQFKEALAHSPELVRDLKIVRAKIEYAKQTQEPK